MRVRRQNTQSEMVIWATAALMLLGMLVLVSSLWKLQVKGQSGFESEFVRQTVRRVRLPSIRGKIYDTNGKCLADSVPSYCIAIYTEELRIPRSEVANTLEVIHKISERMKIKPEVTYNDVVQHIKFAPERPLIIYRNLDPLKLHKWRSVHATLKGRKTPGLPEEVEGSSVKVITKDLIDRRTSTAANTLELVHKIAEKIGLEPQVTYKNISDHIYARRPLPLMAWKNISDETMAKWADLCSNWIGTDIYCQTARNYPEGENLAHVIGYTSGADAVREEDGERVDFDMRGITGSKGLEGKYDTLLEGEPGMRLVQIDVSGYRHRDLQTNPPKAGGDLQLTIDANIQRFAMEALSMHIDNDPFEGPVRGAVVVLDPNNGDVLAMVSCPSFDPNKYMHEWKYRVQLQTDPNSRVFNRAVYGQYPPGSIFKPLAVMGVLREHPEYARVIHDCPGYHMIGKRKMRCNASAGHGELSIRQTLEHSCNVFMYKMVLECGYKPIHDMAKEFGLGQVAGLFPDLEGSLGDVVVRGSKYGNLPEKALNKTDSCNLSIGQGKIEVAPLQMAMAVAAIANGGMLYRPRLVSKFRFDPERPYQENPTWPTRRIDIPSDALRIVRGGMHDVIMSGAESAKQVQVGDIVIAGKTGSAEYGPKEEGKKYTWMISFAPFDFPRYAIAFVVEDGEYGGTTVAPRLHELYSKIFEYDGTLKGEDA